MDIELPLVTAVSSGNVLHNKGFGRNPHQITGSTDSHFCPSTSASLRLSTKWHNLTTAAAQS